MKTTFIFRALAALILSVMSTFAQSGTLQVYLSPPGAQSTTVSGVTTETFDTLATGIHNTPYSSPGIGTYTGSSTNPFGILNPDVYGGGTDSGHSSPTRYLALGNASNSSSPVYLTLTQAASYFGFWWSAGDQYNRVDLYQGSTLYATFSTQDLLTFLNNGNGSITALNGSHYQTSVYFGNPNSSPGSNDASEPFVYVSFVITGASIDKLAFYNLSTSTAFESDNHSVIFTGSSVNIPTTFVSVESLNLTPTVDTPVFSPGSGTYASIQTVSITSTTSGASIRYTLDGTTPTDTVGTLYSGAITVGATETVKAIAYKSGMANSSVATATYTINLPQVAAPTFSPSPGTYTSSQSVTISTTTSGASIRYTTDGTTPSETAGTQYAGAISVSGTQTIRAIAYKSGMASSSVVLAGYTINIPVLTTISPTSGLQGQVLSGVQITGQFTHFAAGTSNVSFSNPGVTASSVSVSDATHLSVTVTIAAGAATGASGVTITTGSETASGNSLFAVNPGTPLATAISPNSGLQAQVLTGVQITGQFTHFAAGTSSVSFSNPGVTANSMAVTDSTHLTVTVTIAPGAATGSCNLTVTTGGETATGSNLFTVGAGTPALTSMTPASGQQGQVLTGVQIVGLFTHFAGGISTVSFSNSGVTASAISVTDNTHLTATLTIAAGASTGLSNVTVTTGSEVATGTNVFTVGAGTPALTSMIPASGQQGQVLTNVQIAGQFTHFASGTSTVSFSNTGVTAGSISVTDAAHLTATVTIAAGASTGSSNVTVTTGSEVVTGSNFFTVGAGTPAATPTFSPAAGTYSSPQTVTIATTTSGASIRYTVDGSTPTDTAGSLYAAPVAVNSSTTIKAVAFASGYTNSTVGSAIYTISLSVTVTPATVTLYGGQSQAFSAAVTNTSNQAVTWSNSPAGVGTIDAASGIYTAPATVATQQTVTITARSQADGTSTGTGTVTLMPPISVTVSPATDTVAPGQTRQFTATVANTSNQAVTWTLTPTGYGTISSTGLYTAPASVATSQNITVSATSVVDTSKSGSAVLTLLSCSPSAYSHVRAIVIDHTKVPNTDQVNFPVLISGTYSYLATVANGGGVQNSSGYDIILTSDFSGTTKLDHEIESYNPATGALSAWVRIPTLSHTTDTVIYLNYGNSSITVSQENKSSLWSGFASVYHFGTPLALSLNDSIGNNHLTGSGGPAASGGQMGGGFTGSATIFGSKANPTGLPTGTARRTLSIWFRFPSNPGASAPIGGYGSGSGARAYSFEYTQPNQLRLATYIYDVLINWPFDTNWHLLTAVLPSSATNSNQILMYLDGAPKSIASVTAGTLNTGSDYIGVNYNSWAGGWHYPVQVDELRVTASSESADWIATEYNSQNSPSTFYTIYAEGQIGISVAPTSIIIYGGQTQQFTVTTVGSCGGAVNWSNPSAGSISSSGLYSAPATISTQQNVTLTATSQLDSTKTASSAVTLMPPISVTLTPQNSTLSSGQTLQFTATVQNVVNPAVTWSINPSVGSISATGLYTPPTLITTQQSVTVTATSVADVTKSASATITLMISSFAPIRTNAGGPAYTDPQGRFWAGDTGFSGACASNYLFSFNPPAGSNVPVIYQTGRTCPPVFGPIQFQANVPNMDYVVTLKFADPDNNAPGQRVFNVSINGQTVLSNLDVVAHSGGRYLPWDAVVPVTVTNGQIAITFTGGSYPIVNAIEILAKDGVEVIPHSPALGANQSVQFTATVQGVTNASVTWSLYPPSVGSISSTGFYTAPNSIPSATSVAVIATYTANPSQSGSTTVSLSPTDARTFTPMRINAGGPAYTDPQGRLWAADSGFSGACASNYLFSFTPPAGSNVPVIYQTGRTCPPVFGPIQFQAAVPNMEYVVTLKFADPDNSAAGQRVFNVSINGQTVLSNLDVVAHSGGRYLPWDAVIPVTVTNSQIAITFTGGSYPIINAIEILAAGEVQVYPAAAVAWQSQSVPFWATAPDPNNPGVAWSLTGAGSVSQSGVYTAPAVISSQQNVTVTATSIASPAMSASATVGLWPPSGVTMSPLTATLRSGQTQQFTATPINGSTMGVIWSTNPGGVGSFSPTGLYTPPSSIYTPQTITVIATSVADGSQGTATVSLLPTVTVTVSPATTTLGPSALRQYTASVSGAWNTAVTWSINPSVGSISSAGIYTAPSTVASTTTVTITATSVANSAASGTATLTLSPAQTGVSLTVSPATASVVSSQTQQFTATVSGTGNTAVTWSLIPNVGSISSSGLYTAPAGVTTPQTITVQATSTAYPTVSGIASIAISPAVTNSYSYRRPIAIDHTKVPNTDQIGFPVLISGTYSYLATIANGGKVQNANGYDIIFSSDCAGLQKLDHEIQSYNPATGAIAMWVVLPVVAHSTDTIFYLSYGNNTIATTQENRASVDAVLNSTAQRSADWIATNQNNQTSPSTFYTIYPENTNSIDPASTTLAAAQSQQFAPMFTVSASANRANPLVPLGAALTPSPAESLTVSGNNAYVCDDNEVAVIDVSSAAVPNLLTTALSSGIKNSGNIHCSLQSGSLVAFSDAVNSVISGSPAFSAFSLSNPVQPQFSSAAPVNVVVNGTSYPLRFFDEPSYVGHTAFVPTGAVYYVISLLDHSSGDFYSIDLTDPANPRVLSTLLTPDSGNIGGGSRTGYISGATLYNSQTAYVTGTTGFNSGKGKLIVADISNPSAMTVVTEVDVNGTVELFRPLIQGNLAVALGGNGGMQGSWNSGQAGPYHIGNVVITTFDLTNPRSPAVLNALTTSYVPSPTFGMASAQIGTNLFLFGGVRDASNHDVLLLVDTSNPVNPVVTPYPVLQPVTRMVAAGNVLHTTVGAAGYAAYQIPGTTPTQYGLTGSCSGLVTWTLFPTGVGSINAAGLYTAPTTIGSQPTVTVTATSQADPTQFASAQVTLSNVLLTSLSGAAPSPYVVNTPATFVATVTSQGGSPVSGVTVTFTVTGVNARTGTAVTDANGRASYSYTGTLRGADSITATPANNAASTPLSVFWVNPTNVITTTAISGQFFTSSSCPSGCEAFAIANTQQPVFTQTFPDLVFSNARPFTDTVLDGTGATVGTIVTQAGVGSLAGFSAVFRGSFVVTQAGSQTINVTSQDGFIFGIGGGATRVSGVNVNAPSATVFSQYPIMGANNGPTTSSPYPIVVSFPAPGSYPYEIDYRSGTGGALALGTGVRPLIPLVLTSNSGTTGSVGHTANFTVLAKDEAGNPLASLPISVLVSGANPQNIIATTDSTGRATVTYTGAAAGTDLLQASATTTGPATWSNQLSMNWVTSQPPQITVTGDMTLQLPNRGTYTATVTDPVAPAGGAITVVWSQVSGPGTVLFDTPTLLTTHAAFPAPGTYVLQVVATDALGSTTLQLNNPAIIVQAPVNTAQGWIGGPLDSSHLTGQVPITVAAGTTLTSGTLTYYSVSNPNNVVTLNANTTGSGQIGVLDTTTLANGTYYLLLNATNSSGTTMGSGVWLNVQGDYKPGRVTTSVTDLVVPAPGLPIQISRTYDSLLRGTSSDFGYGWSLGIKVQMEYANTNDITLTINGQRRTFYFTPTNPFSVFWYPAWTAEPGLFGTLVATADNCNGLTVKTGNIYVCAVGFALYQPQTLVYTDAYGRVYTMGGDGSLNSVKDAAGNTLTVTATGITGSNGLNVPFVRDGQGRITQITDPLGKIFSYGYDTNGNLSSVTYPTTTGGVADTASYTYDTTHRYTGGTDPRGKALPTTQYDGSGRLQSVTLVADATTSYTTSYAYDLATHTTTITYPDSGVTRLVYDAYGMLLTSTDPLNHTTTNVYDANHNLTSVTDPLGHTTTYTYDGSGNRTSVTNPGLPASTTTYNPYGEPTQTTDELGNTRTFTYDTKFWPKLASDTIGPVVSFTFNPNGTMASKAVGYDLSVTSGKATTYLYDAYGNLTSETDALNRQTAYTYDTLGHKTSMTPPSGGTTNYTYDALGRLQMAAGPLGRTTTYAYDANGNKTSETDANNHTASYAYDNLNRLSQTTYPNSTTTSYKYDFRNNVTETTDQGSRITRNVYDLAGRLTSVTTAYGTTDAATTSYTYYDDGRKHTETDPLGHTTTYNYDPAGRMTSVVDSASHTTTYAYDNSGNQTSVTDPNLHTTQSQYDSRRRLKKTTYHDLTTTQYAYDGPGNLTSVTDQAGNLVQYTYDASNQLRSVVQVNHPDPTHNTTNYAYDNNGNLITSTDANSHASQTGFDVLNQLKTETMPSGGLTQTRNYDPAGNLLSLTDYRGKTTTYTYDALNRLTSKIPDASLSEPTISFTYTATGKRASMTDASGTTTYTYDNLDRLKTKATPQGTLTYTYDSAGNVASITSSNTNGTSVAYTYDNLNRLATVVDNRLPAGQNTTTYSYDPASNLATVTYPNGLSSGFSYDTLNRLTTMNGYQYTLGPTGNRTVATEPSGRALNWSYDGVYRLTNETISLDPNSKNGSVGYVLDPVGNRLSQTASIPGISTASFTFDSNDRLSTEAYDNNGNTLVSGARTFTYDFENRLKSMNAGAITLQYDGDGNRVAKTVGGATTRYLVDDLNPTGYAQVFDEIVSGSVQRAYTYGRQLISQNQLISGAWKSSFYGYDGASSVRTLTDATGTVTDTYDYDAWGNTVNSTGTTPNVYLYRGEQYDSALNLYYLRSRYLDTLTGRFITKDTDDGDISDPSSLHKYLYGSVDPVNRLDRSGRATTMENTLLLGTLTLATAVAIYETERPIKCIWCEAVSQLAAGFFVDMLPMGLTAIAEVPGRVICTVAVVVVSNGLTFSKGGKQNVKHEWVIDQIGLPLKPRDNFCEALRRAMAAARKRGDSAAFLAMKATYKALCR